MHDLERVAKAFFRHVYSTPPVCVIAGLLDALVVWLLVWISVRLYSLAERDACQCSRLRLPQERDHVAHCCTC